MFERPLIFVQPKNSKFFQRFLIMVYFSAFFLLGWAAYDSGLANEVEIIVNSDFSLQVILFFTIRERIYAFI